MKKRYVSRHEKVEKSFGIQEIDGSSCPVEMGVTSRETSLQCKREFNFHAETALNLSLTKCMSGLLNSTVL
ncbi:MAG: hypothetical protein OXB86_05415 [Bdellovibrionales bacterium]|nr:hypothetical protein [Bdellovibrionales bacterium]